MTDPRLVKLAEVMIHYSLRLKKGDLFCIYGESVATPLVIEAYREALRAGAHPNVRIKPDGLDQVFFGEASDEQLTYISEFVRVETEKLDAMLYIWGSHNTRALSNCPPQRMALCDRARVDIFQRRLERIAKGEMTWCGTQYPTNAEAQEAEMSLAEYEDFVFNAGFLDRPDPVGEWKELSKKQDRITKMLSKYKRLRVVADDTDLTLNVAGRNWINCDGKENFPDGEIFTSQNSSPLQDTRDYGNCIRNNQFYYFFSIFFSSFSRMTFSRISGGRSARRATPSEIPCLPTLGVSLAWTGAARARIKTKSGRK